ncbi:MAG: TatD family hydrolase [Candidatus Hodarchaeales archaeon]|jgi:TatD DNase family protein
MYVDIHCHLPEKYFFKNINEYIKRWSEQKITNIVSMSQNYKDSLCSLELSQKYPEVIPAVGIHPWKAHKSHIELDNFKKLLEENKTIKILGEVGLDYHSISQKDRYPYQKKVVDFFFHQAEQRKYRLMLHVKGAEEEITNTIETNNVPGSHCCIHWYSGPIQTLKKLIDLDCYFSCGPALSYSAKHQKIPRMVPIDRLLTESDGNVKYQGQVGHPGMMPEVITQIANLRGEPKTQIAEIVFQNSYCYLGMV